MTFAADSAVAPAGPGRYSGQLHERWLSLVGIHGGYTAAVVVNAITAAVNDPSRALRSFATQFAAVPRPGPVDIEVTVERTGRSMTTTSARLLQDGQVLQVAHAASSKARPGLTYDDHDRPRDADPGDVPRFTSPGGVGHFQNADVRLDPDVVVFGGGDKARVAAWLAPLDGEPVDAAWVVAMCDLLPPAVFTRTNGPVKAATIEYVVHLATGEPSVPPGEHVYLACHSPLSTERVRRRGRHHVGTRRLHPRHRPPNPSRRRVSEHRYSLRWTRIDCRHAHVARLHPKTPPWVGTMDGPEPSPAELIQKGSGLHHEIK